MSTREPSSLAVALGQIRYRLALSIIGFGVFAGCVIACAIPLCVYASYFDERGTISESIGSAIAACIPLIAGGLTYRWRGWIVRKALEDAPPEPVRFWTGGDIVDATIDTIGLVFGLVGSVIVLTVAALLLYGGYLLFTTPSVSVAILIGAMIIALAILLAAFGR